MRALLAAVLLPAASACAQPAPQLPGVTVQASRSAPQVERSYRRMWRGVELFERRRAALAPQAQLRFRLLPRRPGVDLDGELGLTLIGRTVEIPVAVAPDRSFSLPADRAAWDEDALLTPDRPAGSLSWRADVRTSGLPPGVRRLGDLRLECLVGMTAGLVSEHPNPVTRWVNALADGPSYCSRPANRYLFFADRPLWGMTLVHGSRRAPLASDRLWAGALGDAGLPAELAACDCALLLDRAHFAPLEDDSWPDDTLLEPVPLDATPPSDTAQSCADWPAAPERLVLAHVGSVLAWRQRDRDGRLTGAETLVLCDADGRVRALRRLAARP